eukprot:1726658-Ditylum_brightwellii.AAC.1
MNIQSDNAWCYKKPMLLLGFHQIAMQHGFSLSSYIYTRIQDGKGCIDAYFTTAMQHVIELCCTGSNVVTPIELVNALNMNRGISNTVDELIGINRPVVAAFETQHHPILKKVAAIGEHMEVIFDSTTHCALVFEVSNMPYSVSFSLVHDGMLASNETQPADDKASEDECDDNDDVIVDMEAADDIQLVVKGNSGLSRC